MSVNCSRGRSRIYRTKRYSAESQTGQTATLAFPMKPAKTTLPTVRLLPLTTTTSTKSCPRPQESSSQGQNARCCVLCCRVAVEKKIPMDKHSAPGVGPGQVGLSCNVSSRTFGKMGCLSLITLALENGILRRLALWCVSDGQCQR